MYTTPADPKDEPAQVSEYLRPTVAAVWNAFDAGRALADEFFSNDRPFDSHLWAHLVRYQAVLSLKEEPKAKEWELRALRHSGIEIIQDPFRVRIYKEIGGGPQSPGHSQVRRDFFQQMTMMLNGSTGFNVILHWKVKDDQLHLGLCKPKGWWKFKASPKVEWNVPITYDPIAGLQFESGGLDGDIDLRFSDEDDFGNDSEDGLGS